MKLLVELTIIVAKEHETKSKLEVCEMIEQTLKSNCLAVADIDYVKIKSIYDNVKPDANIARNP